VRNPGRKVGSITGKDRGPSRLYVFHEKVGYRQVESCRA